MAYLEDEKLVEYHIEETESEFKVGDFYLGKVGRVVPGVNAAFVEIGHPKGGFLHYSDLSPNIHSILRFTKTLMIQSAAGQDFTGELLSGLSTSKEGRIEKILQGKPSLLVQVAKEPINNKGPRLTCELTLVGRYLIVIPFHSAVSVSKKIASSQERKRLRALVERIRASHFGVIVRTVSQDKDEKEISEDYEHLVERWKHIQRRLFMARAPVQIYREQAKSITTIRDLLNQGFTNISVNDSVLYADLKQYIGRIWPEKMSILQNYSEHYSVMNRFGVTKQLSLLFGRNVSLPSGAYLVIEKTEALHVIDVNSGRSGQANTSQEDSALQINLEAVREIVRQIRLRDLGGIIIIDFIDVRNPENKKRILQAMSQAMLTDRAQHVILPLSKFSVMQLTRQRVRPEVNLDVSEVCFACKGSGKVRPLINVEEELMKNLRYILPRTKGLLRIRLHPFVLAYLQKGWLGKSILWSLKFRRIILLASDPTVLVGNYVITNRQNEKLL